MLYAMPPPICPSANFANRYPPPRIARSLGLLYPRIPLPIPWLRGGSYLACASHVPGLHLACTWLVPGLYLACGWLGCLVTNHESLLALGGFAPPFCLHLGGAFGPSLAGAHLRDAVESLSQNPNQGGRASSRALIPEDPRRCLGSRGRLPSRTGSFGTISGPRPYQNFPAACDQAEPWQRVAGMTPSVLRLCSFTPWKNFVGFSRPRVFNR
jgi:hypothetical protein